MPQWLLTKVSAEIFGAILLVALLGGLWAHGYNRGKASMADQLADLKQSYALEAAAEKGRHDAQVKALTVRNSQIENDYARSVKDLGDRARAAESRYYGVLRDTLQAAAARPLSPADPARESHGAAGRDELERINRSASGLSAVGESCERDAARLQALQQWAAGLNAIY